MFGKKKKNIVTRVKLSDKSVAFIRDVVMGELDISSPIGTKEICRIEDWINDLDLERYDEDGNEIALDSATAAKIAAADDLLAELMGIWGGDNTCEDFDDLNARLGLQ